MRRPRLSLATLVCDLRERVWVLVSGRDFCSYLRQPLEPLRTLARLGYYLQEGLWGSAHRGSAREKSVWHPEI